jgi:hypothetical protein
MNYLKKKLKAHKRAVDDDEDYGDYIPATPPHPSELSAGATTIRSNASGESDQVSQPSSSVKSAPKFVLPPKESKEEWQFFAQLTARVQQTVANSEKQLEQIKANTNVDEIEAETEKPYYFAEELEELDHKFEQKFSDLTRSQSAQPSATTTGSVSQTGSVVKPIGTSAQPKLGPVAKPADRVTTVPTVKKAPGKWVNVEESIDQPDPEAKVSAKTLASESKTTSEQTSKSEEDLELKRVLAEDFGFQPKTIDLTSILTEDELIKSEEDYMTDPFDTEHVEQRVQKDLEQCKMEERAKRDEATGTERSHQPPTSLSFNSTGDGKSSGSKLRSVPCTPGERVQAEEIDIETTLKTGRLSRYASREDVHTARSLAQSRCNSVQSLHQLSRRDSTNPFEIEAEIERRMSAASSPQNERQLLPGQPDLDGEADNVPNAIAALTEDFCKTISDLSTEFDTFESKSTVKSESPPATDTLEAATVPEESNIEPAKRSLDYEITPESDVERPLGSNAEINESDDSDRNQFVTNQELLMSERHLDETYDSALRPDESEETDEADVGGYDGSDRNLHESESECESVRSGHPFDPFATIVEEESTPNRVSLSSNATAESTHECDSNTSRRDSVFSNGGLGSLTASTTHHTTAVSTTTMMMAEPHHDPCRRLSSEPAASQSSDISPAIESRSYFDPFQTVKEQSPSAPTSPIDELSSLATKASVRIQERSSELDANSLDRGESPFSGQVERIENEAQQLVERITNSAAQIAEQRVSDIDEWRQSAQQQSFEVSPTVSPQVEQAPVDMAAIEPSRTPEADPPEDLDIMPPPPDDLELVSTGNDLEGEEDDLDLPPPPPPSDEQTIESPVKVNAELEEPVKQDEDVYPPPPMSPPLDQSIDRIESSQVDESNELHISIVDDPFDTSIYDLNGEGGARYANKNEMDAFDRKFDRTTIQTDDQVDAFASPLPARKLGPDGNVFDLFDPYASPSRPPRNTPVAGHRPMPTTRMPARRRKRRHRQSARSSADESDHQRESARDRELSASSSGEEHDDNSSSFESDDSDANRKIHFVIREKTPDELREEQGTPPPIPPPPSATIKSRQRNERGIFSEPLLRVGRNRAKLTELRPDEFNAPEEPELEVDPHLYANLRKQQQDEGGEAERPETPLFEVSEELLEDFEKPYEQLQWNLYARYPIKKKITGNRFWKMITVRFVPETGILQVLPLQQATATANGSVAPSSPIPPNPSTGGEPMQEIQMQASYTVSEISSQQYDQFGKIFTFKLQYTFYREKAGAETGKKLAHNVKVMQGKLAHFTQKFNHMVNVNVDKLNLHNKDSLLVASALLQHTANSSELVKLASHDYEQLRSVKRALEHCLFRLPARRERTLTYRAEEIQAHIQDECWIRLNARGHILEQKARVRLFLLSFLNGQEAQCEIGLNDIRRQGNEVVGRYDILPITTEQWIRVENAEFHSSVHLETFEEEQRLVRLVPPDACQFEFMRFRVRPPKNRELPLQVSAKLYVGKSEKVSFEMRSNAFNCLLMKLNSFPCINLVDK